jgi:hypothetical protein
VGQPIQDIKGKPNLDDNGTLTLPDETELKEGQWTRIVVRSGEPRNRPNMTTRRKVGRERIDPARGWGDDNLK